MQMFKSGDLVRFKDDKWMIFPVIRFDEHLGLYELRTEMNSTIYVGEETLEKVEK